MDMDGDSAGQGKKIGNGLGRLDSQKAEGGEENPNRWDKEDALPGGRQEGGRGGTSDGLLHHVTHDDPALCREADALEPQRRCAAGDDRRIVPE